MEERQDCVEHLASGLEHRHPGNRLGAIREQVAMGEDHALRPPGRAPGVLQQGDIGTCGPRDRWIEWARRLDEVRPPGEARCGLRHCRPRRSHLGDWEPQADSLGCWQIARDVNRDNDGPLRRRPLGHERDGVPADDDAGAVIGELVGEFILGVERIVLDDDRPEPQHGVKDHDMLGAVRQDDRHPITARNAEILQGGRRNAHAPAKVRKSGLPTEEIKGNQIAERLDDHVEHVGQRALRDGDVGGDVRRVVGKPGPLGGHASSEPRCDVATRIENWTCLSQPALPQRGNRQAPETLRMLH